MYTIGTAGHVDHGKSTLIKALTGIDPDRLREEKERGMTIDLGFAWLKLPSGREVSVVDVPGHERFIKNMLAGVGGIDLALLVIAADEGVMPQTREHLAILDLLRVKRGVVALTKADMVEPDWLELVRDDVSEVLVGTVLEDAPVVAVSGVTRRGLDELTAILDQRLSELPPRRDVGRPRLPIDRVFTIAGFGTVVTGTLIDGELRVGQELEITPSGVRTRARGLQTHKRKVEVAEPGSRVAVNLASVAVEDIRRGDVVTIPGWLKPTVAVDVHLRLLSSAGKELRHNAVVSFHVGSAETVAKVGLLDRETLEPGERGWCQVHLQDPVAVAKGDLFVIRSSETTLGGGEVVDTHPKRHRRFQASVVQALEMLEKGTPEDIVLQALQGKAPVERKLLAQRAGLPNESALRALEHLLEDGEVFALGEYLIARIGWDALSEQIGGILKAYHVQYPLRKGMPKEELKSRLGFSPKLFGEVLGRLKSDGLVVEDDGTVRMRDHEVKLTADQERRVARLFELLAQGSYSPPARSELEGQTGVTPEVVEALVDQGRLAKVGESIVYPRDTYDEMVKRVVDYATKNGKITVGEARDLFGTSRKYALALMEHLDELKVTRRIGDERVLR